MYKDLDPALQINEDTSIDGGDCFMGEYTESPEGATNNESN